MRAGPTQCRRCRSRRKSSRSELSQAPHDDDSDIELPEPVACQMTAIALRFVPQSVSAAMFAIAPIAGIVFSAFFGMALPVLPLHVHHRLGMSPFVVGLVAGSQFAAALLSRLWAGRITDTHGA